MKKKIKIIGDLKITEESGGNEKHTSFWHLIKFCGCVRSTHETIMCNPTIETEETYYSCGYWKKTKYEKVKETEGAQWFT